MLQDNEPQAAAADPTQGIELEAVPQPEDGVSAAPESDPDERRTSTRQKLSKGIRKGVGINRATMKVPLENKIGTTPTGWHAQVGYALQRGISDTARNENGQAQTQIKYTATEVGDMHLPEIKFSELAPSCFAKIREQLGVKSLQYQSILGLQDKAVSCNFRLISSDAAAGKSKAFFFLSADQRYMLKTMTADDLHCLLSIKNDYLEHITNHKLTLLPQYLAIYKIKIGDDPNIVILVMNNFFAGQHQIHTKFDLKGSRKGRTASAKEVAKEEKAVLKDNDFVRQRQRLPISCATGNLKQVMTNDIRLLQRLHVIDYSLIVAYHDKSKASERDSTRHSKSLWTGEFGSASNRRPSEVMNVVAIETSTHIVYVGIVDILTLYGPKKYLETFFMGTLRCCADISCQPPRKYGNRFLAFMFENSL